jgi:hypothetical protein
VSAALVYSGHMTTSAHSPLSLPDLSVWPHLLSHALRGAGVHLVGGLQEGLTEAVALAVAADLHSHGVSLSDLNADEICNGEDWDRAVALAHSGQSAVRTISASSLMDLRAHLERVDASGHGLKVLRSATALHQLPHRSQKDDPTAPPVLLCELALFDRTESAAAKWVPMLTLRQGVALKLLDGQLDAGTVDQYLQSISH